ncbi:MAG: glycosyltransferase [Ignavibacteria bacterium]|nr:glycosyltransferase [Ignavibacteria bacterium]MBI3765029.1 glycosyltransferase [Ignavibacteriales bacterium]
MKRSVTLVIAVYNAVRYLELILAALERQSFHEFEVIIADDGSGLEMRRFIESVQSTVQFPMQHVWHEDQGFRKNRMLNRAIATSQSDYLIFIDGDCLPHREFLSDHWSNRRQNVVLCGRRVNFSKPITERLTLDDIRSGKFERISFALLLDGLLARSSNLEDAIRIKNRVIRSLLHRNRARILGCNFSVEKRLLEQVNGFNEDYQAPGLGEDSDIAYRLELIGARLMTLRYLAVLFHLYHPRTHVGDVSRKIFEQVVAAGDPICRHGLRNMDAVER